jgi:hypothetical protein
MKSVRKAALRVQGRTLGGVAWSLPIVPPEAIGYAMKKLIATVICLTVLMMGAMPLAAQTRSRRYDNRTTYNSRYSSRYDGRYNRATRYDNRVYRGDDYRYEDDYIYDDNRSVWEKHRDKITTAGGALGGAALGGIVGGKKGAIIGAIAGGAGAAIYTYKVRDKYRRY